MLGERIAMLRQEHGMSQAALARAICISPSAVGMYEQGRREPSSDILVAISRLFGVTVDYLLTGEQEQNSLSSILLQDIAVASPNGITLRRRQFSRQELVVLLAALLVGE